MHLLWDRFLRFVGCVLVGEGPTNKGMRLSLPKIEMYIIQWGRTKMVYIYISTERRWYYFNDYWHNEMIISSHCYNLVLLFDDLLNYFCFVITV